MRSKAATAILAFGMLALAILVAACSQVPGSSSSKAIGEPQATATAPAARGGPGSLRSTLQGSCRLTAIGAQIRVEYSAAAFGSSSLSRVRLFQDEVEVADSGPLEGRRYSKVATFNVEPGEEHVYRVQAEGPPAASALVQSTVHCGTEATPRPARRA